MSSPSVGGGRWWGERRRGRGRGDVLGSFGPGELLITSAGLTGAAIRQIHSFDDAPVM